MVMADKRFAKKRNQLPKWISSALLESDSQMSVDQAVATSKKFLKQMSKPFPARMQDGISTWSYEDLMNHKEKVEAERDREVKNGETNGDGHVHGDQIMAEAQEAEDAMAIDVEAAMMELISRRADFPLKNIELVYQDRARTRSFPSNVPDVQIVQRTK
ncbi:TFIIH/NER complex ATP-dependent 5'-3' DNA helicase subunit [Elasticomyces elasticus]|nr:TFIIH/NER complex ATP-dependent 5'-3' DNA helicase subunit [Elasticomyces elasticus]